VVSENEKKPKEAQKRRKRKARRGVFQKMQQKKE